MEGEREMQKQIWKTAESSQYIARDYGRLLYQLHLDQLTLGKLLLGK